MQQIDLNSTWAFYDILSLADVGKKFFPLYLLKYFYTIVTRFVWFFRYSSYRFGPRNVLILNLYLRKIAERCNLLVGRK